MNKDTGEEAFVPITCPECTEKDREIQFIGSKVKAAARSIRTFRTVLRELQRMGDEGMKPDYNEWLTFHSKVALMAKQTLAWDKHWQGEEGSEVVDWEAHFDRCNEIADKSEGKQHWPLEEVKE